MAVSASSSEAQLDEQQNAMKYILVSGGVISGVGKGVITSSLGTLLKSMGLNVTAIKIDPYLNIDAGTFSPYEHGKLQIIMYVCSIFCAWWVNVYMCVFSLISCCACL